MRVGGVLTDRAEPGAGSAAPGGGGGGAAASKRPEGASLGRWPAVAGGVPEGLSSPWQITGRLRVETTSGRVKWSV